MPSLTNNTGRKPPKRRKDGQSPDREHAGECDNGDDNDSSSRSNTPPFSHSQSPFCGSDDDDNENFVNIKPDLILKEENEILSRWRDPVSDRGLSAESSGLDSPFPRNAFSECIKESSRSENSFMYLNNLYTFSSVKRPSMKSLAAALTSPKALSSQGNKVQNDAEGSQKMRKLHRIRSFEEESEYENLLKEKRGFEIKKMDGDGNCLFRSVADQLFGDQERHAQVRKDCMDYMERNREHFSQYVVEDFDEYLRRKRTNGVYGNHVEIQSIAELYNRRVEIYCYELTPLNIFQGEMALSDATPIRISYHNNCHFNSVVDTRHPFVPLGPVMPESYKRTSDANDSIESEIVKSVVAQTEQKDIDAQVVKSVEKESEEKELESIMLKTAKLDSVAADTEAQVVMSVEGESEKGDIEAQMIKTAQAESEARNLEDEIMRQVMLDSAKEANVGTSEQDDIMLQFVLQQSSMDSFTNLLKSIKVPPLSNQQSPPPPPKKH